MAHEDDDDQTYRVVVNHEEQYSIWPTHRDLPLGWSEVGKAGLKAQCLEYIREVWTDMRPLSLRKQMDEAARNPARDPDPAPADYDSGPSLVRRLSQGTHNVQFSSRPERSAAALRRAIERGYVHILFPETRGGTELGVRIDASKSDVSRGDFDKGSGDVSLVGTLTLDDEPVECVALLSLSTLAGQGNLRPAS